MPHTGSRVLKALQVDVRAHQRRTRRPDYDTIAAGVTTVVEAHVGAVGIVVVGTPTVVDGVVVDGRVPGRWGWHRPRGVELGADGCCSEA